MTLDDSAMKRAAAAAAVAEMRDGMVVGLGTGSTAAFAVELIGERVAAGLSITAVATSRRTEAAARALRIPLLPLRDLRAIDLCIDGVDEIDPQLRAIKGGGGAMLVEKIVASMAGRNVAIADASKRVDRLGVRAVPVEILSAARGFVTARVERLGGSVTLRGDSTPFVSDSGNPILDCRFESIDDPAALASALSAIPGVFGHGLFLTEIHGLYLADETGEVRFEPRR